ncbi:C-type lectin domain family 4 member A-like [Sorex fumeus]|uniref:C-type lectin domain family 4 member A-like n=1 Tax=Sorex fumeus TaxID=62283 RepID=UPI0024AE4D84|nr:C-type lectin domain family 4 member A-like [Sorex fumeus]
MSAANIASSQADTPWEPSPHPQAEPGLPPQAGQQLAQQLQLQTQECLEQRYSQMRSRVSLDTVDCGSSMVGPGAILHLQDGNWRVPTVDSLCPPSWCEESSASLLNMTTEITYAEVRFKNGAQSSDTPSQAPAATKEETSPTQSNTGCLKLLLAVLLILLLLTISFLIASIIFFQKYSNLVQEEKFTQELTHTELDCKKEKLTLNGKSWSCCPKNWKSFDSSCYFISSEIRNWTDSEKHCAEMRAHLLVVDSKEEQDFIIKKLKMNQHYYLGLSDLKNEHVWEWVNETPYNQSATFWHKDEPSVNNEHCVVLDSHSIRRQWGWNNIPCYNSHQSICEMLKIYL